ncbi:MAG: T9SS type A sorting domain-containing protein, partial [Duncaniella sp.]|nr:T9SS type A sorting domain-containing protein [Duncaniella sp.]
ILTKWSINTSPYRTTGEIPVLHMAGTQYDPATKVLGQEWMTPTKEQFQELFDNCDFEGLDNGVEFTSRINGNKIFFPNTGFMYVSALNSSDNGCYMTAEIDKTSLSTAKVTYAKLTKGFVPQFTANPQAYKGYPIRAVKHKEGETGIDDIIGDTTDATIDVYTITGVRILTQADRSRLTDLPAGIYILRTSTGKTTKIRL